MPGKRKREELIFNLDFDSDRLLFENYIPIMSVLFSKEVLAEVEGFCRDLVLFEDWDFWIRVSRNFSFQHIDRVTAEYRFYGVSSIEKSHRQKYRYDEAKAKIFDRTLPLLDGRAWVNFQNSGWLNKLQEDIHEKNRRLSELEREVALSSESLSGERVTMAELRKECEQLHWENKILQARYDESRAILTQAYDEVLKEKNELYERLVENKNVLTRIQSGFPYRFYRRSRVWFSRLVGTRGPAEKKIKKC